MPTLHILQGAVRAAFAFTGTPTLAEALCQAGFAIETPCGGRGTCRKCAVQALAGAVSPPADAEVRAGARLACQARLLGDAQVRLHPARVWQGIQTASAGAQLGTPMPGRYGAAVDLGTTTVAARIYDLQTGAPLAEHALLNPQTAVAADVMGRISAALAGGQNRLQAMAETAVQSAVADACRAAGVPNADALCVAGNTVMLTLLAGRNVAPLAAAPFAADSLFGYITALGGAEMYLPPCAGAFIGADITCAALSTGLTDGAQTALLCDIGTNGELMLWHSGALYAASAPAGPAFEGGQISRGVGGVRGAIDRVWAEGGKLGSHVIGGGEAVGLCGSGVIDTVAALLQLGLVDATGAADAAAFTLRDGVQLTAADVRAVQLAKAAVSAATGALLAAAGAQASDVKRVWLAGGFGSHMSVQSAAAIGLLPARLAAGAQAVGNAALAGAAALLLDTGLRARAERIAGMATVLQLGGDEGFERRFMAAMDFPAWEEA